MRRASSVCDRSASRVNVRGRAGAVRDRHAAPVWAARTQPRTIDVLPWAPPFGARVRLDPRLQSGQRLLGLGQRMVERVQLPTRRGPVRAIAALHLGGTEIRDALLEGADLVLQAQHIVCSLIARRRGRRPGPVIGRRG